MSTDNPSRAGRRRRSESGHAVIEVALLAPWIFFLFVGVLDFGFYAYAAISTQNAARAAVLYTSRAGSTAGDKTTACLNYVLPELRSMPNVGTSVTSCGTINSSSVVNVDAVPVDQANSADGGFASRVTVQYRTLPMIPIPGLVMGQMTLTRIVEARILEPNL